MFNPSRLTLARQRRGMTKSRLAEMAGLTVRSISGYEGGNMAPSQATITKIAQVLRFPEVFFSGPDIEAPLPESASFRALTSMTARQRDAALGAGGIAIELSRWIDERFTLPAPNVPELIGYEPEAAAEVVRAQWGIGERPIQSVVHLLEAHGVRVFSLAEECAEVDAFSLWVQGTPFVFLNTMKSAEHGRFDAAHELGHLVLHRHAGVEGRTAEREANAFAAAFLMPRGSILAAAPRYPSIDRLVRLKKSWRVSVSALAHRLHALNLLSDWNYRMLCIEISRRGYRKKEPEGIHRETSQVLHKVFSALREEGMTKVDVARCLQIYPEELDALVFGLVMVSMSGGSADTGRKARNARPNLRLV